MANSYLSVAGHSYFVEVSSWNLCPTPTEQLSTEESFFTQDSLTTFLRAGSVAFTVPFAQGLVAREKAEKRARRLMLQMLTPVQRAQMKRFGLCMVIGSKGNAYIVNDEEGVHLYPQDRANLPQYLCLQPADHRIPDGDSVLARKWLLESDEGLFLGIAIGTSMTWQSFEYEILYSYALTPQRVKSMIADVRKERVILSKRAKRA